MKVCCRCKKLLPLAKFNKNCRSRDGHKCYCRKCQSVEGKKYYRENTEKLQQYRESRKALTTQYNNRYYEEKHDEIKQYRKEVYRQNRELFIEQNQKYRQEHPEIYQAQNAIHRLRHHGLIKNEGICPACKKHKKLDAHHPDYSQPELIEYLCRSCHLRLHHRGRKWLNEQTHL